MKKETVNLQNLLQSSSEILRETGIENPRLDVRFLASHVFSLSDIDVLTTTSLDINTKDLETFHTMVEERAKRKPLSYIINAKEFMSLEFYVEEGYFTPRPDTEHLVEKTVETLEEMEETSQTPFSVLDYCTGTGAVGVSVAYYYKDANVYGYDDQIRVPENKEAFSRIDLLPKLNADKIGVGDRFTPLTKEEIDSQGIFDIIVSNPPYIPTKDLEELEPEVLVEPHHALDGGEDGLDVYREIIEYAKTHLKENGYILFEIGYHQREDLFSLLSEAGYTNLECFKDYGDLDRVIKARKEGVL